MLKQVAFTDVIHQDDRYAILLLDRENRRVFKFGVEVHEGAMLSWVSQGAPNFWGEPRRQSTHQFLLAACAEAGVEIRQCVVSGDLAGEGICEVHLRRGRAARTIHASTADAVVMALLADRPLLLQLDVPAASWDMETLYGRTPLGRPTQHLIKALAQFWQDNDPRIYQNAATGADYEHLNAGEAAVLVPVALADILEGESIDKIVVFQSKTTETLLPIRMPSWEAIALAHLTGGTAPDARPNTFQFAAALLSFAGFDALNARIFDLRNGIYLAALEMQHGENSLHFELRPVDAACLAAALDIPLYATTGVLHAAGTAPEKLYRSMTEIGDGLERIKAGTKQSRDFQTLWGRVGQILRGV